MKWRAAVGRVWKLPVIWDVTLPEPEPPTVHVVYVAVPLNGPRLPGPLAAKAITEGNQG